jgi:hypothetical protein
MLLAVMVCLAVVPTASAHGGDTWYWSASRAGTKLATSSRGPSAFSASYLSDVDCLPIGISIWSSGYPRQKLYKHFDCSFNVNFDDGTYRTVERIVHVISAQDFVMSTP